MLLDEGKLISNSKQKTQAFNNYFVSQTHLQNSVYVFSFALSSPSRSLSHITANEITMLNLLRYLNKSKPSGPDGIQIALKLLKLVALVYINLSLV